MGSPTRLARSIRNVAILMLIWGGAMLCLEVLVMGAGLPLEGRLARDPGFLFGAVTLVVTATATIGAVHFALGRSRRAYRLLDFGLAFLAFYGFIAFLVFGIAVGRDQPLGAAAAAISFSAIFLVVCCIGLWKARVFGRRVIDSLMRDTDAF